MDKRLRVLLIEDDSEDAALTSEMLPAAAFAVHVVARLDNALPLLTSYDVVVLDLSLPDSRGIESLHAVLHVADIPVIVLTGNSGLGIDSVRAGAQDYIVKGGFDPRDVLRLSVLYAFERHGHNIASRNLETMGLVASTLQGTIESLAGAVRDLRVSLDEIKMDRESQCKPTGQSDADLNGRTHR